MMMIKLNKIYNIDCIDFMKELESDSIQVDIIVTSPPYNIGKNYGTVYNDKKPRDEYLDFIDEVGQNIKKILKDDGSFFLNIGNILSDSWLAIDVANIMRRYFALQNTIIWNKSISIEKSDILKKSDYVDIPEIVSIGHYQPVNSQKYLNNNYEEIYHFSKLGNVKLDKIADGFAVPFQDKSNIGRYSDQDKRDRGNVWFMPYKTIQNKDERPHPAAFPEKLPYYCIKIHGYDSNTIVYDPFMGSGTTALACMDLKVNYLGTEINKEYVKSAELDINKRINKLKNDDYSKQRSLENYL